MKKGKEQIKKSIGRPVKNIIAPIDAKLSSKVRDEAARAKTRFVETDSGRMIDINKIAQDGDSGIMRVLVLSLLLLLLPVVAQAELTKHKKWGLYNQCKPISLVVEGLDKDAEKIGLKEESIINLAESRLRAARIYNKDAVSWLYINVNVLEASYNVGLYYTKQTLSYGEWGSALTWWTSNTGIAARTGENYILSIISQSMDKFVLEYLEANEKDCKW